MKNRTAGNTGTVIKNYLLCNVGAAEVRNLSIDALSCSGYY